MGYFPWFTHIHIHLVGFVTPLNRLPGALGTSSTNRLPLSQVGTRALGLTLRGVGRRPGWGRSLVGSHWASASLVCSQPDLFPGLCRLPPPSACHSPTRWQGTAVCGQLRPLLPIPRPPKRGQLVGSQKNWITTQRNWACEYGGACEPCARARERICARARLTRARVETRPVRRFLLLSFGPAAVATSPRQVTSAAS